LRPHEPPFIRRFVVYYCSAEHTSLRKQHATALKEATRLIREQTGNKGASFEKFDLYTLRHTCLTRWAPHMDPWTLMRLAGHRDMATTMRYIHPEDEPTRQAMQRARDSVDRRAKEAVERARRAMMIATMGTVLGTPAR
jgi:integrase